MDEYLAVNHIQLDESQFNNALNRYVTSCIVDDDGLSANDLYPILRGGDVYTMIGLRKRRKVMCKLCNEEQWDDKDDFLGHCNKHLRCNRDTISQVLDTCILFHSSLLTTITVLFVVWLMMQKQEEVNE